MSKKNRSLFKILLYNSVQGKQVSVQDITVQQCPRKTGLCSRYYCTTVSKENRSLFKILLYNSVQGKQVSVQDITVQQCPRKTGLCSRYYCTTVSKENRSLFKTLLYNSVQGKQVSVQGNKRFKVTSSKQLYHIYRCPKKTGLYSR